MMVEPRYWPDRSDPQEVEDLIFSQSGVLAYDVGANFGRYARKWAENFRDVIALEPNPHSYAALVTDKPDNVTAVNVAASDVDGDITLLRDPQHEPTGQYVSERLLNWWEPLGSEVVSATTLDLIADEYGIPDVVKIDTEGHEFRVLRGALRLMDENVRWIIEIHSRFLGESCKSLLRSRGYEITRLDHIYRETSPWYDEHFYIDAVKP